MGSLLFESLPLFQFFTRFSFCYTKTLYFWDYYLKGYLKKGSRRDSIKNNLEGRYLPPTLFMGTKMEENKNDVINIIVFYVVD